MKVNLSKTNNLQKWLKTRVLRLGLWFILSLALSLIFFKQFWVSLPTMISADWVFGQYHVAPWGVLGLCLIFLWLKRKEVLGTMIRGPNLTFTSIGLVLIVGAVLMPSLQDYLVFQVLLASLGVFVILFSQAAKIPSILLAIYGFVISFPLAIERFAENAYSQTAIAPVIGLLTLLGYPLQSQGPLVHFTSLTGEPILVTITLGCAGPATMGVFIALFTLMMLDMPLPRGKAVKMFLFGVAGTWLQSIIRLVFILLLGYYVGEHALWTAHYWTIYVLFPLWYVLFAYVYFRQAGPIAQKRTGQTIK